MYYFPLNYEFPATGNWSLSFKYITINMVCNSHLFCIKEKEKEKERLECQRAGGRKEGQKGGKVQNIRKNILASYAEYEKI